MSDEESNRPIEESPASGFVQAIGAAVSAHRLYPPEHPSCLLALERLVSALEPLFRDADVVFVENQEDGLYLNGERVTRPSGLVLWLSDQLRRRLIKAIGISADLEPADLSALCNMLAASVRAADSDALRERLGAIRSQHVRIVESAYRAEESTGAPDDGLIQEAWRLAIGQVTGVVVEPREAKAMTSRLEKLSELHGRDDPREEVDVLALLAGCTTEKFGEELPEDSRNLELLLSHILAKLHKLFEEGAEAPSSFRRRQILGNVAQHILSRTPGLISSIAQSAGPLTPQVQARTHGRTPGEVLQHLFMRTPEENRPPECVVETVDTKAPSGGDQSRVEPVEAVALLDELPSADAAAEVIPRAVNDVDVMTGLLDMLVHWITGSEAPAQREIAADYLHDTVHQEVNEPSRSIAGKVLGLLDGSIDEGLTLGLRRQLFEKLDCRTLLLYFLRELPTRQERVHALRTAWEVLGDQVLQETIRCCVEETDEDVRAEFGMFAGEALAVELAPLLAQMAGKSDERSIALTLAVVDRLEPLEQAQLLKNTLGSLGRETPLPLVLRLVSMSSAVAHKALRDWVDGVNVDGRRAFAEHLLSEERIADLEITADIAAGRGAWRRLYPQREKAIAALASSQTVRARQALKHTARRAVWSLSRARRALGKLARATLAELDASNTSGAGGA